MNFEVNGIPYFLTFDADAAEWCLLTPSHDGIASMEIYDDGPLAAAAVPSSSGGARRVNWTMPPAPSGPYFVPLSLPAQGHAILKGLERCMASDSPEKALAEFFERQ